MPTIRIEDDVFNGLKSIAEPFADTPNTVIRRLLEDRGVLVKTRTEAVVKTKSNQDRTKSNRASATRASANTLTPQPIYEKFLLHVLATKPNGRGDKNEVTKNVIDLMKSRGFIGPADLEEVSTGETKSQNTIAWGRNALKERGLVSSHSPRGIWELTPKGFEQGANMSLPSAKE